MAGSVTKAGIFPSEGEETEALWFLTTRKNSGRSEIDLRLWRWQKRALKTPRCTTWTIFDKTILVSRVRSGQEVRQLFPACPAFTVKHPALRRLLLVKLLIFGSIRSHHLDVSKPVTHPVKYVEVLIIWYLQSPESVLLGNTQTLQVWWNFSYVWCIQNLRISIVNVQYFTLQQ